MKPGRGPLGKLPALSASTRRALVACTGIQLANAAAMVAFALGLSIMITSVVGGSANLEPLMWTVIALLARACLTWAAQVVSARAAAGAKEELRAAAIGAATARGPEYIAERGPAELTWLSTSGLDALDAYFTKFLPALIAAVVLPFVLGAVILFRDPSSAVIIGLTLPLIPLFAALIGSFTEQRVRRAADANERLAGHLGELIRALPVLTAFGRAGAQSSSVARVSDRQRRSLLATLRVAFCSSLALELIATLSVALIAVSIGLRLVSGELDLATGLLVLILAPEIYLPLRNAGAAYHASTDGLEAVARVATIVGAGEGSGPDGVQPGPVRHQLRVRDLRVTRRAGHAPDGESCTVHPGEVHVLDGPSGSGKSTLFAVLLGFATPSGGSITIDDTDLGTLDRVAWRRQLAWIPQNPRFAATTVHAELRLSTVDLSPELDDAELTAVCTEVSAAHLLRRPVDELSVGERQRVAAARALLRIRCGATVLLADEPTAHLDPFTASKVDKALRATASRGAVVLLASHRSAPEVADEPRPAPAVAATKQTMPVTFASLRELVDMRTVGGIAFGAAATASGLALTAVAAWLIARASQHPAILTLTVAIVAVRLFGLSKGFLRYLERLLTHDSALRTAGRLRERVWRALVDRGPAATAALRHGDGAQRLVDEVDAVRDAIPRVLQPPIVALIVSIAAVTLETVILPSAGISLAVALVIALIGAPVLAAAVERRATAALAQDRREVTTLVGGLFACSAELLANGADRLWRKDITEHDRVLRQRERRQALGAGAGSALTLAALGGASVLCAGLAATSTSVTPVLAALVALVPLALLEIVEPVSTSATEWRALRVAHTKVTEICAPPSKPAGFAASKAAGFDVAKHAGFDVRLRGVDAGWPGGAPVLRGVDLDLPVGSNVAVIGESGAGKSTFLALLLGFLTPSDGVAQTPAKVAWAPQEPQLVSTTLRENLRIGDPHADDEQLADALRTACLDGFTDRLDLRLGAAGSGVSGGEAQRIAIARALLAAPHANLVLLDEPTAHLDIATAEKLLRRLDSALAGKTVVHVTHRADEAARADHVLEVHDGGVRVASAAARTGTA
jgi:ATP-binding cassette subfamily C protein CydCD